MSDEMMKPSGDEAFESTSGPKEFKVKRSIKVKIGLVFAVVMAGMVIGGVVSFYQKVEAGIYMETMSSNAISLKREAEVSTLNEALRADVLELVNLAHAEAEKAEKMAKWNETKSRLDKEKVELFENLDANSVLGQYDDQIAGFSADMRPDFMKLSAEATKISAMVKAHIELPAETTEAERKAKVKAIEAEYAGSFAKTFKVLDVKNERAMKGFEAKNKEIAKKSGEQIRKSLQTTTIALGAALLVGFVLIYFLFRSLSKKIGELLSMIDKIKDNDYDVSYHVSGDDELKLVGESLKGMAQNIKQLQENNATFLRTAEEENKDLNDSIVELLQTVFSMTQKDLTVKAEVKENMVGTIADSINMVIRSTNEAMVNASQIAHMVQGASEESQEKSNEIFELSRRSRDVVGVVIENIEKSIREIRTISKVAQESKEAADQATESTSQALAIVKETVSSMGSIRETISSTETKIKKLAERSQEIGFIVQLIGDISERTHVLALNATIQAAVAGDAGRGFAAIAEEIQKLAENTKEATNKIARLVENIQVETSDTIQMVNQTIDKVVSGVKLAESSGQQMTETQGKTVELADAVKKISVAIAEHEALTGEMKGGAETLGGTQDEFSTAARDQLMRARSLLSFSLKLQETVNEFKTA